MEPAKKIHPALAAIIVIALIGIITVAVMATRGNDDSTNEQATTSSATSDTTQSNTQASDDTVYADGTYSAEGTYITPGGEESIDLTVTIADNVITATSLKTNANSGEAEQYQSDFASGYKNLVIGKKVGSVSLSRVAGSSLTSTGFNDALDQIKTDATETAQ